MCNHPDLKAYNFGIYGYKSRFTKWYFMTVDNFGNLVYVGANALYYLGNYNEVL